ncbi:MAG: hypothetical protein H6591_05725 [Flavobacteriales bacterium]|nr:hypothetical protein [Flavobacteriales bacterium]
MTDANGCSSTITDIQVNDGITPQITSQAISGACLGLQQGVATVTFDQPLTSVAMVSGQGVLNWFGNTLTVSQLAPGPVVLSVFGMDEWCMTQVVLDVVQDPTVCGTLNGRVYADLDGNCSQDASDPGMPNHMMVVQPGNRYALTDGNGDYEVGLVYGNLTLDQGFTGYSADCLIPFPTPFTLSLGSPSATIDVAETPLTGPDVAAFLGGTSHRIGSIATYSVQARNTTPFTLTNVGVELTYDPLLTFAFASESPNVNTPGYLHWTIPSIGPFGSVIFSATVQVPANIALLGTIVNATATVLPTGPDNDPSNNAYSITRTLVAAYDPNDKLSVTSSAAAEGQYYIDLDNHVDHTIRFQNTGNAEADHVFILDTIADLFDLGSFQLLGASHPLVPTLLEDRTLRFDFFDIQLPDSTANEAESHGFVSYRLKPIPDLQPGQVLENTADIFFDVNPPIRTNTTTLTVEMSVGLEPLALDAIRLWPNPTADAIEVITSSEQRLIEVVTMQGTTCMQAYPSGTRCVLDVSGLAPGSYFLRSLLHSGTIEHGRFIKH